MSLLSDKIIIIAGGLGLLGKNFVNTVLENGGTAIIVDINQKKGEEFQKELAPKWMKKIAFLPMDITSKESILKVIAEANQTYRKIDGFVNSSYPRNKNWGQKFEDVTYTDFCENVNLHLGGYFLCAQQFGIFFRSQKSGVIINIASIQGVMAPKFDTYNGIKNNGKEMTSPIEYTAIKAAIIHLTQYMAKYFKDSNVRFNCISPGGILDKQPEEFLNRYRTYCTSKGMLDPSDINGTLLFLLSDLSKYINGQNIIVDDGWSL